MPVLSLHIILTEPSVSTAGNFLTMALRLLILVVPIANTMATIAAKPSGIAATANEIEVINNSLNVSKVMPPSQGVSWMIITPNMIKQTNKAIMPNTFPSSPRRL